MTARAIRQAPSLIGGNTRRFWELTWSLALTEFKLRFFGSALGYFWSLLNPLLLFAVLYFVFTQVFTLGNDVEHYPVYLLTSIVFFTFFQEATQNGLLSLIAREAMLRKMRFPRLVIPASVVVTALLNLGASLLAVLVFALGSGVEPRATWLEMPLLILWLSILAMGLSMLLAALFVRYRDIAPIWDVVSRILFYATPVLYVITVLPDNVERKLGASPLAVINTQMRHAFLDPTAPTAAEALGGGWRLLIPIVVTIAILALGAWVFMREAPRIAEDL